VLRLGLGQTLKSFQRHKHSLLNISELNSSKKD